MLSKFQGFGPQMGLRARIWPSRPGFGPQGQDLGLKARIWASWSGFEPQGQDLGHEAGGGRTDVRTEKKKEKFLYM